MFQILISAALFGEIVTTLRKAWSC